MAWPVFFTAFALRRERRLAAWAILAAGAAAGLAQYAWLSQTLSARAGTFALPWTSKARLIPIFSGVLLERDRPR